MICLQQFLDDPRTHTMRKGHPANFHKAVIVKRGHIIAEASNGVGSRSRGSGYSRSSIHAERKVVKQLGDISKLRGADMYVMRFSLINENEFMNSKPCRQCFVFLEKCMREYGLKNVYYTD
jgi:hypothetical protein